MKLQLKFDYHKVRQEFLKQKLEFLGKRFTINDLGEVEVLGSLSNNEEKKLLASLNSDGINVIDNQNKIITQKIKELIIKMIYKDNDHRKINLSQYLEQKLPYSYVYLAKIFSEETHQTIEKFTIQTKIELVKELIVENKFSLSEIAYKLNYSSVSHLSNQFKRNTGFTPTCFSNLKKESS